MDEVEEDGEASAFDRLASEFEPDPELESDPESEDEPLDEASLVDGEPLADEESDEESLEEVSFSLLRPWALAPWSFL